MDLPVSQVMIIVRLGMLLNIISRLIARRVTGDADIVRILIDPDIIKLQIGRHVLADGVILRGKVVRHSQVHDQGHGLEWDHALTDVAVRSDGAVVEGPGFVSADEPGHLPCCTGGVFEGVDLVFRAVVPPGVEVGQAGHGLLIDAATVGVDFRDARVIHGGVVWNRR